jgi:TonB family protein
MGYQALLFCPDEKTARTVTQVLSELDFSVVPCTEPFAAVKKLMGEHFDAVVVDCDNEQNATLLFKSARNTVHNQSSLAVAVVEGQAGVAKAFRIGANLVLTKPINVEQAKGTLRVARGLLRKSEAAKPAAGAASAAIKPAAPMSATAKPVVQPQVPSSAATSQTAPFVLATSASPKLPPRPQIVASVPASDESDVDLFEIDEEVSKEILSASAKPAAPISVPKITAAAAATEPKTVEATSKPAPVAGFGASAASAPAPAREPKPAVVTEPASTTIAAPGNLVKDAERDLATDNTSGTATFTFGGNVDDNKSASGGGKKAIIAVAAVVLIAAGYAAWSKFGPSSEAATIPARVATQKAITPSAAPMSPSSISSSQNPSANSAVQAPSTDTPAVKASGTAKANPDTRTVASNENMPTRPGKDSGEANSSKPTPSAAATDTAPATKEDAKPIVMKSATKAGAKTSIADATAPTLSAIDTAPNGTLPNLMGNQSKAPTPVLQTMSISQGVSQGLLVKKVQPPYPQNAMTMHIEGPVQLLATISKTGDISAVKVLSGEPQLARAAAAAVKQWKYKPYLLNGEPVEIQTQVTINFKLPH